MTTSNNNNNSYPLPINGGMGESGLKKDLTYAQSGDSKSYTMPLTSSGWRVTVAPVVEYILEQVVLESGYDLTKGASLREDSRINVTSSQRLVIETLPLALSLPLPPPTIENVLPLFQREYLLKIVDDALKTSSFCRSKSEH